MAQHHIALEKLMTSVPAPGREGLVTRGLNSDKIEIRSDALHCGNGMNDSEYGSRVAAAH